ncbi:MAG: M48 family metalloprotease [Acidobacteriota bacterium]
MIRALAFGRGRKCVALLLALAMAAGVGVGAPGKASALSLSEEKELGSRFLGAIREHLPLVQDGEIVNYVNSVGNRLVQQVGTTSYQFQFFVIDDKVPNAFAVPGGYIFVYRGLVEMMASEGELAGVLAHEIAHVQAHHLERRLKETTLVSLAAIAGIIAGVFLGMGTQGEGGTALAMGSMAGAQSYQLKYSRENEEEADRLGLRYLCAAGYPPRDMASVMRKLKQATWVSSSRTPSYLLTHPALGDRVEYLEDLAKKHNITVAKPSCSTEQDFPLMLAALVCEYGTTEDIMMRYEPGSGKGDCSCLYAMGRLRLKQAKVDEAIALLQSAARQRPTSPFILSTLGAAYIQQGKLAEAQKVLQSALLVDPSAPIVRYRLALVLKDLGRPEEALENLRQIESLSPIFPDIDYNLGVLLGQVNNVGRAHLHLARYYENTQDWNLAFFHYEKARALNKDSVALIEELDLKVKEMEKRKKQVDTEKRQAASRKSR